MQVLQQRAGGAGADMSAATTATIRDVLRRNAGLSFDPDQIGDDDDLFEAGMTSHASVSLMLGLEDAFDVEFPDSMLKRSMFESISSITAALEELAARPA
jgi:acyl carrier protein